MNKLVFCIVGAAHGVSVGVESASAAPPEFPISPILSRGWSPDNRRWISKEWFVNKVKVRKDSEPEKERDEWWLSQESWNDVEGLLMLEEIDEWNIRAVFEAMPDFQSRAETVHETKSKRMVEEDMAKHISFDDHKRQFVYKPAEVDSYHSPSLVISKGAGQDDRLRSQSNNQILKIASATIAQRPQSIIEFLSDHNDWETNFRQNIIGSQVVFKDRYNWLTLAYRYKMPKVRRALKNAKSPKGSSPKGSRLLPDLTAVNVDDKILTSENKPAVEIIHEEFYQQPRCVINGDTTFNVINSYRLFRWSSGAEKKQLFETRRNECLELVGKFYAGVLKFTDSVADYHLGSIPLVPHLPGIDFFAEYADMLFTEGADGSGVFLADPQSVQLALTKYFSPGERRVLEIQNRDINSSRSYWWLTDQECKAEYNWKSPPKFYKSWNDAQTSPEAGTIDPLELSPRPEDWQYSTSVDRGDEQRGWFSLFPGTRDDCKRSDTIRFRWRTRAPDKNSVWGQIFSAMQTEGFDAANEMLQLEAQALWSFLHSDGGKRIVFTHSHRDSSNETFETTRKQDVVSMLKKGAPLSIGIAHVPGLNKEKPNDGEFQGTCSKFIFVEEEGGKIAGFVDYSVERYHILFHKKVKHKGTMPFKYKSPRYDEKSAAGICLRQAQRHFKIKD